eukprot:2705574-Amphidinium_carterae.1
MRFGFHGIRDSNTEYLIRSGWRGLRFDRQFSQPELNLHKESILSSTIVEVFEKYAVPSEACTMACPLLHAVHNDFAASSECTTWQILLAGYYLLKCNVPAAL